MQVTSPYFTSSYYTKEQEQAQYLKSADLIDRAQTQENRSIQNHVDYTLPRETYGLTVLKEMSDDEYNAFLKATSEMTESEKILAAQTIYRFNQFHQPIENERKNPYISHLDNQNFIQSYKNAYESIIQKKQNI